LIGNNGIGTNQFGTNITLDTFNNRVFNHEVFGLSKRFSIASSEVIDIVLDTTLFDKETLVLLPFSITGFDAGPLFADLYVGTTYTGGTNWSGIDRNFCDTVESSEVFAVYKPTITLEGVKQEPEFMIPSNGTPAVATLAGAAKSDLLFKLKPGINYMLRITNTSTSNSGTGLIAMNWFEV